MLQTVTDRFAELRANGVKAVFRVNYNEELQGTDASMAQMLRHMDQLQPLLEDNKDVIAFIEIGYFGQWGEWHDWCGGENNSDLTDDICSKHRDTHATWSTLTNELLEHTPADRFILIRYPGKKQAIYGGTPVDTSEAYTSQPRARVGHHNDCFLASPDDMGTYQLYGTSTSLSELKNYLSADTEYLPMGGETCYATSNHRFSCDEAIDEMERMHWTYLNQDYYDGAINTWASQGCKDEIEKRLGYRLNLRSASLPDTLYRGEPGNVSFTIHNSGFARVHNPRTVYLRLLRENQVVAQIPLSNVDIREVGGGESLSFSSTISIPDSVGPGFVDAALWLPDEDPRNWDNSRFSIRLAYQQSESDWSTQTSPGHNVIASGVPIRTKVSTPTGFILVVK